MKRDCYKEIVMCLAAPDEKYVEIRKIIQLTLEQQANLLYLEPIDY